MLFNKFNLFWLKFLSVGFFFIANIQTASAISNISITPADLNINATTSYTISFLSEEGVAEGGFVGVATTNVATGPDFSGIPTGPITIGTSNGDVAAIINTVPDANVRFDLLAGESIPPGTTLTFTYTGIVNPAVPGLGPDYSILTFDFVNFVTVVPAPGTTYTNPMPDGPVVIAPIVDLTASGSALVEADGPQQIVANLNTVFEDGNGDPLTFSVEPGNDANIATATINNNALTINPLSSGTTTFNITATSINGSATDTFDVRVIGELDNASVIPQDLDAGATGVTYNLSFTPAGPITNEHNIWLQSSASGGPDYTNATVSVSGGSLTGQLFAPGAVGTVIIQITGGTANSSDTVNITINNVENPDSGGQGPDYNLIVRDFSSIDIDKTTISGSTYDAVGIPTVTSPISDQSLNEANGSSVIVADLNTVFTDGNGDILTFTVEPGNDANIATASINGNELTVTPTGPVFTTITIKASDLPGGQGSVTDSFNVSVIGLMDNASMVPSSLIVNEISNYEAFFTLSNDVNIIEPSNYSFIIYNADVGGPDYSSATLNNISAGTLTASISVQSDRVIVVELTAGSASSGDNFTVQLENVMNPATVGLGPDYQFTLLHNIDTLPNDPQEQAVVMGDNFVNSDVIFINGFEMVTMSPDQMAKSYLNIIPYLTGKLYAHPFYDQSSQHYLFLNQTLSRDDYDGQLRSQFTVIEWLTSVLIAEYPDADWDADGLSNQIDSDPFGINN